MILKIFTQILMMFFVVSNCYAVEQPKPVFVGQSFGGGTVFCVSNTWENINNCSTDEGASGYYGLIMTNIDQIINFPGRGIIWSGDNSITGAQSDDNGARNTDMIIAATPRDTISNNAAHLARACQAGGYIDWYLPSKNELNKLFIYAKSRNLIGEDCTGSTADGAQCLVGGGPRATYWSSTECSFERACQSRAWVQYFFSMRDVDIIQDLSSKTIGRFGVRAIRFFNVLEPRLSEDLKQGKELKIKIDKEVKAHDKKRSCALEIEQILSKMKCRLYHAMELSQ